MSGGSVYPHDTFHPDDIPQAQPSLLQTSQPPIPPPGMKRPRRLRSAAGAAHNGNVAKKKAGKKKNGGKDGGGRNSSKQQIVPIFLQKTYDMVEECDTDLASWTEDGDMFVIKDPEEFADQVIPKYFDHKKFTSFARQLNFYGFKKMQNKPIRNTDYDERTAKHVTFHNENFKRDRKELLLKIQRSTKNAGVAGNAVSQEDMNALKKQVSVLEKEVENLRGQLYVSNQNIADRLSRLEYAFLNGIDDLGNSAGVAARGVAAMDGTTNAGPNVNIGMREDGDNVHHQSSYQLHQKHRNLSAPPSLPPSSYSMNMPPPSSIGSDGTIYKPSRTLSASNNSSNDTDSYAQATLPPHPKQKSDLPVSSLPPPPGGGVANGTMGPPAPRGISTGSFMRGFSNESFGVLDPNGNMGFDQFESGFLSQLVLDDKGNTTTAAAANASGQHDNGNDKGDKMSARTANSNVSTKRNTGEKRNSASSIERQQSALLPDLPPPNSP